jgi:hypothetical protein
MWTWAPTRKPRRRRGLVYWNAARSHSEPTTVFDDTLVFSGMTRFEKRRDKKHGRRQCHTIDIPDHRCWMQFRSALCNTYSLHRANLVSIHLGQQHPGSRHPSGTSVAGCSRETWLYILMLMLLQENAGSVGIPGIPRPANMQHGDEIAPSCMSCSRAEHQHETLCSTPIATDENILQIIMNSAQQI